MIEKIAILIMALINQTYIFSSGNTEADLLGAVVNEGSVDASAGNDDKINWNYYMENLKVGSELSILPSKNNDAKEMEISSKSAVVMDIGTNAVLFSKEENRKMPIASLSKLMTAIIAMEKIDLSDRIVITEKAIKKGGKRDGLFAGEEIMAEDLLKIMLVNSNNVAAEAIAEHVNGESGDFIGLMNERAELLGLENTRFFNASGLDQQEENYSTAYEIAQIFDYGLRYSRIWEDMKIQRGEVWSADKKTKHILKSTNLLLGKVKNIEGGKTGFTDDAGECMVLVAGSDDANNKIVSVVLNSSDRFKDTEKIINWTFDNYRW
ncbi:MAG: serine hydrolase [Candidatus Paceibacterota bacterium]|jgi:D-alanyl-D-alanine carboxypeptidase